LHFFVFSRAMCRIDHAPVHAPACAGARVRAGVRAGDNYSQAGLEEPRHDTVREHVLVRAHILMLLCGAARPRLDVSAFEAVAVNVNSDRCKRKKRLSHGADGVLKLRVGERISMRTRAEFALPQRPAFLLIRNLHCTPSECERQRKMGLAFYSHRPPANPPPHISQRYPVCTRLCVRACVHARARSCVQVGKDLRTSTSMHVLTVSSMAVHARRKTSSRTRMLQKNGGARTYAATGIKVATYTTRSPRHQVPTDRSQGTGRIDRP
jgi:hypothetical protein